MLVSSKKDDWGMPLLVVQLVKDRMSYALSVIGRMRPLAEEDDTILIEGLQTIGLADQKGMAEEEAFKKAKDYVEVLLAEAVVVVLHDRQTNRENVLGYVVPNTKVVTKKKSAKKIIKGFYQFRDYPP